MYQLNLWSCKPVLSVWHFLWSNHQSQNSSHLTMLQAKQIRPFPKYSVGMNFIWYILLWFTLCMSANTLWDVCSHKHFLWLNCKPFGRSYRVSSCCFINSIVVNTGRNNLIYMYTQKKGKIWLIGFFSMALSTMFRLYHGGRIYLWRKPPICR